jgi:hypothetical protein
MLEGLSVWEFPGSFAFAGGPGPCGFCKGGSEFFILALLPSMDWKDGALALLGGPALGRQSVEHRSAISQSNLAGARHL